MLKIKNQMTADMKKTQHEGGDLEMEGGDLEEVSTDEEEREELLQLEQEDK